MKIISILIYASLLIFFSALEGNAQYIDHLSVVPSVPTSNDSINLVASCYFPSGSCNIKSLNYSIINQTIDCDAMHCLGMAAYICYDDDTYSIGQLPAGSYTFRYTVNVGLGPFPCTPGIVPGPTDSITFQVTAAAGMNNLQPDKLILSPNPCENQLTINNLFDRNNHLFIYDLNGRLVQEDLIEGASALINTSLLLPGGYILKTESSFTSYTPKLFYKR
ncbi:MAG: T9SS type A sorting domain-containing protein [Bacteroidota bacterium]